MTRLALRRAASVATFLLYVIATLVAGSPYFLVALAAIALLELWVQRSTEIGWRIFRTGLDERQEALRTRILDLAYRALTLLALAALVFTVVRFNATPTGRLFISESQVVGPLALVTVALFVLPGHIAAWIEPVPHRDPDGTTLPDA